ncbi:acyl-CoA thioesterase [Amorphus sp. 3PC139-8]|uniref:acyl-CoA thioesterase n=1 Tax=Amorphus sp. 3PC139-8 TaxID=2735676 RepID=UPI00345D757E
MDRDNPLFQWAYTIGFGDCDPAGIVFYPNYLRWFDATFHALLRARGKRHEAFCDAYGLVGTGLMDVGATFRSPGQDGDDLVISIWADDWRDKAVRFAYRGTVGERLLVEGYELRGLFVRDGDRLKLGSVAPLKAFLEGGSIDGDRAG